jgi:hypothetical protein
VMNVNLMAVMSGRPRHNPECSNHLEYRP